MSRWNYNFEGIQHGPMSEGEIVQLIQSGQIPPKTLVCEEGKMHWEPANKVACFQVEIIPGGGAADPAASTPARTPVSNQSQSGGSSSGYPPAGGAEYESGTAEMPPVAASGGGAGSGGTSGGEIALGCGGLAVVGLVLWFVYNFFFGNMSVDELGESVFDALQDDDVEEYMDDCTPFEFSMGKIKKMLKKVFEAGLDHQVEKGKITEGERDRRMKVLENGLEEEFDESKIESEAKKVRESFRETIERGKRAGLNWDKAEFEFVDTSRFESSEADEDEYPSGYGSGDLFIVISEGGKRYKVRLDDCIKVPGYGVLNMDGLIWEGEIK